MQNIFSSIHLSSLSPTFNTFQFSNSQKAHSYDSVTEQHSYTQCAGAQGGGSIVSMIVLFMKSCLNFPETNLISRQFINCLSLLCMYVITTTQTFVCIENMTNTQIRATDVFYNPYKLGIRFSYL